MLSSDELNDGITFVLKLTDAHGEASYWVETLRGEMARHWYDIYRGSQWDALRSQAMSAFHRRVTEHEAEMIRRARTRCIWIEGEASDVKEGFGFTCDNIQHGNGISDEHSD